MRVVKDIKNIKGTDQKRGPMNKVEGRNLEEIKEKILSYFEGRNIDLIYIFGSYANKSNTMDSDVDIAVL